MPEGFVPRGHLIENTGFHLMNFLPDFCVLYLSLDAGLHEQTILNLLGLILF